MVQEENKKLAAEADSMKPATSRTNLHSGSHTVVSMATAGISIKGKASGKNTSLERESTACSSLILYSLTYIMLDLWKQVTTYGMKYYNNNRYPLPQTEIIAITELLKFIIFFGIVIHNGQIWQVRISLWYAIPSVIYAFNNNIYYYALHYATPPVWNILIQLRLVFTALTYKCMFHKVITNIQWAALLLLIVTIALTNINGGQTLDVHNGILIALGLATVGSFTSVIGTITMEVSTHLQSRTHIKILHISGNPRTLIFSLFCVICNCCIMMS